MEERFSGNRSGIKTLLSLYRGNYGRLALALIFFIIKRTPEWALPLVTANIINIATNPAGHSLHELWVSAAIMVALIVQNVPTNYVYFKAYRRAIRSVEAELRQALVRKMQQLSIAYHKEMRSGRLQSKIMRDVEAIETLSAQFFVGLLQIALDLFVALFITAGKSAIVFFFFLITIPLAVALITLFRRRIRRRNQEFRKEMEETSAMVVEMVELIPVTRAHGLQNYEINRMGRQMQKVSERGLSLDVIQELFGSMTWVTFQLFQLFCLCFTGYLAYRGQISVGDVVLYQSYYAIVVHQVSNLVGLLPSISKGMESVRSVGDVLAARDTEHNCGKEELDDVRGDVEFCDVSFSYPGGDQAVLRHLNLHVREGETVALVGPSGAGKTTILNLLLGFDTPSEGCVRVDGHALTDINLNSLRHHLAVVPQNTILFSGTLRDNITYGIDRVTPQQLQTVVEAANLTELIRELPEGLDTPVNEHGANLSGGQRQRISIARALIRDPRMILLDEATSALDPVSEQRIQSALERLCHGRTTLIVAHRLSTVRNADRIVVVDDGHCVESGTYDELMAKKGAFYAMNAPATI